MPRRSRLLRRGSRYYLRAKVPVDLQPAMGRKELKWSLGTSDPREATRLIDFESAKADAIFDTQRQRLGNGQKPVKTPPRPLRAVSEEHARELARTWFIRLDKEEPSVVGEIRTKPR